MSVASVLVHVETHTISYVTSKMLLTVKEIVREIGLDPSKLTDDWESIERALSTWLRTKDLLKLTLEVYNPNTDALVHRWDLDVIYGYAGEGTFWTDTDIIRYNIQKSGVAPSSCKYSIILETNHGRPDVSGWGPCEYRATTGFSRQSIGSAIGGNGIGSDVAYWRKT